LRHFKDEREFELVIHLDHGHLLQIKLKPLQVNVQNRRKLFEYNALLGVLLSKPPITRVVLVLAVQGLLLNVLGQAGAQILAPTDVNLNVHKSLLPATLVCDVLALYVGDRNCAEQSSGIV
tara:strand:+ start:826 stop:1188 length:363 start_codon:yes stop_codon:yes gene_type:complete